MKTNELSKKATKPKTLTKGSWAWDFRKNWIFYLMFLPMAIYLIVFKFIPMFGIVMAFENFKVTKGYFGSEWVWFDNFIELFSQDEFPRALRNTFIMGLLNLGIGFFMPIGFALLLSLLRSKKYKRTIQSMSYMPNFVSSVVVCTLVTMFLAEKGPLTGLLEFFGLPKQNWLANGDIPVFWLINTFMNVWTGMGWGSIVYVAAIADVSGDLHEAAALDGANRFQRLIKITLPCIAPMIVMMLTLNIGVMFLSGFDKILLLYMPTTYETADCLQTFTYRIAFGGGSNYGLSAASSLLQSIMGTILLFTSNHLNKKASGMSLF